MIKIGRIAAVVLMGFLFVTCAASAQIIEEKSGYIVRSGYDLEKTTVDMPSMTSLTRATYSIIDGGINYHSDYVGSGKTSITYDIDWADSGNDLGLYITTPGGSDLGYYHDSIDGRTDGRIYIEISSYLGIESGNWNSKVRGFSVSGTEYYNMGVSIA